MDATFLVLFMILVSAIGSQVLLSENLKITIIAFIQKFVPNTFQLFVYKDK